MLQWDESWKSRRWLATVQELHFYDAIHRKIGRHFVYVLRKRPYRPLPPAAAATESEAAGL